MRQFFLAFLFVCGGLTAAAQPHVIDSTFGQSGWITWNQGNQARLLWDAVGLPDGRAIATGAYNDQSWNSFPATFRFTPDGRLDSTFSGDGIQIDSNAIVLSGMYSVGLQSTGKVVVGGYGKDCSPQWSCSTVFTLFRYKANGDRDSTFGDNGMVQTYPSDGGGTLLDLLVLPDDKILAVGYWSVQPNGTPDVHLVRYLPDGAVDQSFGTNGLVYVPVGNQEDFARTVVLQPDGKYVVGGYAQTNGDKDALVLRFLPSGALDLTFGGGDGIVTLPLANSSEEILAITLLPSGKIFATGSSFLNNTTAELDLRLNADGSVDGSFQSVGYQIRQLFTIPYNNTSPRAVFAQPDGKVVIAGYFTDGGSIQGMVQRLDGNGNLDPSFNGLGFDTLANGNNFVQFLGMCLQPDGRIFCVGNYQYYGQFTQRFMVARYLDRDLMAQVFNGQLPRQVQAWPNPAQEHVKVAWAGGAARVTLVDAAGRIWTEHPSTTGECTLQVAQFPAGKYWIVVEGQEGSLGLTSVVKE